MSDPRDNKGQVQLQIDSATNHDMTDNVLSNKDYPAMEQDFIEITSEGESGMQIEHEFLEGDQPIEPVTTRNNEGNAHKTRSERVIK
jgi:hypothetical protein